MSRQIVEQFIGEYNGHGCHEKIMETLLDKNDELILALRKKSIWTWITKGYVIKIIQAAQKLNQLLWDKHDFDNDCNIGEHIYNEDRMYGLQDIIKEERKIKVNLEKVIVDEEEEEKITLVKNKIELLEKEISDNEHELKQDKEYFNKQVESIKIAELKAVLKKRIRQKNGCEKICNFWSVIFIILMVLSILLIKIFNIIFAEADLNILWSLLIFIFLSVLMLISNYKTVDQNREWNMSLVGKHVTTWEAGFHFQIPIFMRVDSKMYLGTLVETLYMDERKRNEENDKISAKVDFANGAAEVIVQLFLRIFDSYNSTYLIENVIESSKEKMEAGIRSYYGRISIDKAIENRAEIYLRKIIIQGATEAGKFKDWGCVIDGLAVTDIKLPDNLEEKRSEILMAEKDYDISKINREKEKVVTETIKIRGRGKGEHLKALANAAGIDSDEAVNYSLFEQRYEAWGKAGVLIASDSENRKSSALTGAVAGVAARVGSDAVKPVKLSAEKINPSPEEGGK